MGFSPHLLDEEGTLSCFKQHLWSPFLFSSIIYQQLRHKTAVRHYSIVCVHSCCCKGSFNQNYGNNRSLKLKLSGVRLRGLTQGEEKSKRKIKRKTSISCDSGRNAGRRGVFLTFHFHYVKSRLLTSFPAFWLRVKRLWTKMECVLKEPSLCWPSQGANAVVKATNVLEFLGTLMQISFVQKMLKLKGWFILIRWSLHLTTILLRLRNNWNKMLRQSQ